MTAVVTPHVLRAMALERVAAARRGEISREHLRGYLIAMFHAGGLEEAELLELLDQGAAGGG